MAVRSAGLLLHRQGSGGLEILLVRPGGPFWRNRDSGAWQIPKGLIAPGESADVAARRETEEELGIRLVGESVPLGTIRQKGGKIVEAFALEQEFDPATIASNSFEIEWPPRSGRMQTFPEVDAARWMSPAEAEAMMLPSQLPLLAMLRDLLGLA